MFYAGLSARTQTHSTGAWDSFLTHSETSGPRKLFGDWLKPARPTLVLPRWFLPWLHCLSRRDLDQDESLLSGVNSLVKVGSPKSRRLCSTDNTCQNQLSTLAIKEFFFLKHYQQGDAMISRRFA